LIFLPACSKGKRALLGRFDGTRESILVSFNHINHIPARSVVLRRIHHRRYRWRGQIEKAHAAYKKSDSHRKTMDDPSTRSASLPGDIGLLYAKFGDQAQAVHYTRMARAKAQSDVQLMYSEGQVYALLGQPVKSDTRSPPSYRERLFAKRSLERSRKCQIAILPRVCKAREERHFKMISSDHAELAAAILLSRRYAISVCGHPLARRAVSH
jgi:hypothetical protein